jgi:hypothetical protein
MHGSKLRVCTLLALVLSACSDGPTRVPPDEADEPPAVTEDAAKPPPPKLPVEIPAYVFEAGVAVPVTDPGAPLSVQLQVNGATTACGSCSVLIAQAMGGKEPYTFSWSDPTLTGAGPHRVCPNEPTTYSVRVTDDSARDFEGSSLAAQTAEARGDVKCRPADPDAGALQGCSSSVSMGMPQSGATPLDGAVKADPDAGQTECGDAGITFDLTSGAQGTVTVSTRLEEAAFRGGQRYEYIVDRLVPLTLSLGQAVDVEIWGGNTHCELAEKFIAYKLDLFTWHQSTCFTPTKDYLYLLVVVKLNGAIFNWELLTSSTTCAGCSTD